MCDCECAVWMHSRIFLPRATFDVHGRRTWKTMSKLRCFVDCLCNEHFSLASHSPWWLWLISFHLSASTASSSMDASVFRVVIFVFFSLLLWLLVLVLNLKNVPLNDSSGHTASKSIQAQIAGVISYLVIFHLTSVRLYSHAMATAIASNRLIRLLLDVMDDEMIKKK